MIDPLEYVPDPDAEDVFVLSGTNSPDSAGTNSTSSQLETANLYDYFGPDGSLAQLLEGYELRDSQLQMAEAVKQAILQETTAVIEAPTGTGKSIAYLLPALLSGKTVVIATANKSLQSQLFDKDIPFLRQVLDRPISAVVVKGRSNYICNYKWEKEYKEQLWLAELDERIGDEFDGKDRNANALQGITGHRQAIHLQEWLSTTETGDIDDLPFELESSLRSKAVSFPDDCLHRDCPYFYDACWVNLMRDAAAEAQVIITNHHMLLTALQLNQAGERLLPAAPIYVIDEAHQLEGTATAVFETEVTNYTLEQLLNRSVFKEHVADELLDELKELNFLAFEEVSNLNDASSFPIETDLEGLSNLAGRLTRLSAELRQRNPFQQEGAPGDAEPPEPSEERAQYELALENLSSLISKFQAIASSRKDRETVRYAERVFDQRSVRLRLHAAPLDPANLLAEFVFDADHRTVICTSATLATDHHFEHFKRRCGIGNAGIELIVPPVFNYAHQALLYQPSLPAYDWRNKNAFYDAVAQEIERLLEVSRGRALCLFTNWTGLRQVYERLSDPQHGAHWPLRAQGDGSRNALLAWFRETPYSVLLATKSFWEGVDVPGDDLSLVILDKLPFPTPSDPLHSARMKALDEQEDANSFADYMVPLMTLTLKQGFGRLIRRATDRGVVAILDDRLTSKGYGRRARADLPPARFTRRFRDVHSFYKEALNSSADFALNVRAEPRNSGNSLSWSWRLLRLQDGKADQGAGTLRTDDLATGEIYAAVEGLQNLRKRIGDARRQTNSFGVELRCSQATQQALSSGEFGDHLRKRWVNECSVWGHLEFITLPRPQDQ
jgi:ATP-dependent DNA helicase DinG